MTTDTTSSETPPTTGPDAVDYEAFSHVVVDEALLVYAIGEEEGWIQSDRFVDLDDQQ